MSDNMMPERNWRERYGFVLYVPGLPSDLAWRYIQIKKRFGTDIANLVIFTYRKWGKRVALELSRRILSFNNFEELIDYIRSNAAILDENSMRVINQLLYRYKYEYALNQVAERARKLEDQCPGIWDTAVGIFHRLAQAGSFYNPECILDYAKVKLGCAGDVRKPCQSVVKVIKLILGE